LSDKFPVENGLKQGDALFPLHCVKICCYDNISRSLRSKQWILEGFCYYRSVGLFADTDLHNVIKQGTILKDVHKRFIMYQLLKATKYIHSGNVIHRDQKVSNANFYMQPFLLFQSVLLLFLFYVVGVWMFCLPMIIIFSL
jgi:hypothetical protein